MFSHNPHTTRTVSLGIFQNQYLLCLKTRCADQLQKRDLQTPGTTSKSERSFYMKLGTQSGDFNTNVSI